MDGNKTCRTTRICQRSQCRQNTLGPGQAINFITDIAGGTFTLQSTKDVKDTCVTTEGVKTCANNFYTKASKSNTLELNGSGISQGIMPLIQFVQYDTNKSNTYTIWPTLFKRQNRYQVRFHHRQSLDQAFR